MLEDLTAFVTGASQGIGREIAINLAEAGANVTLAARGDGIYDTAEAIGDDERTLAVETDVTDDESVADAVAATVDAFGGLDCVVNNAGIAGPVLPTEHIEDHQWDQVLGVNVVGAWRCVKHAAPHLRESDRASVVNIGSIGGKRPYPNRLPYAASKMALVGMTRTWAYELGRDEITVNCVQPGPVAGPRIEEAMAGQTKLAEMENAEPTEIGENDFALPDFMIQPEEVAAQVAYLAGPHARHITGQELAIDSGGTY